MNNDVSEMDILPEYAFDYSAAKTNRFVSPSIPNLDAYPFQIQLLAEDDGGGYLISFPDFSECISDGATIEEAIANGRNALSATIATLIEKGFSLPEPNSGALNFIK